MTNLRKTNDLQHVYSCLLTIDEMIEEYSIDEIIEYSTVISDRNLNLTHKEASLIHSVIADCGYQKNRGLSMLDDDN